MRSALLQISLGLVMLIALASLLLQPRAASHASNVAGSATAVSRAQAASPR